MFENQSKDIIRVYFLRLQQIDLKTTSSQSVVDFSFLSFFLGAASREYRYRQNDNPESYDQQETNCLQFSELFIIHIMFCFEFFYRNRIAKIDLLQGFLA